MNSTELEVSCNKGTLYPETCKMLAKCIACDEEATQTNNTLCETHWHDAEVENLDEDWDER